MQVPSGQTFSEFDLKLLRLMAEYGFIRRSERPFRLVSGVESYVYVFGREDLTDHPDLEWFAGRKIAEVVWKESREGAPPACLIGIPTAGTALAQAAAMVSWQEVLPESGAIICHRIMREAMKEHGAHHTWVNGKPDFIRHTYWMVDNVATDGGSKIRAAEKLMQDGYPAKEMPCLIFVDRQQGAMKRLEREGFQRVVVAYNLLDITYAFGELGLWPKSAVAAVEEEIRAHQFIPL